MMSGRQRVDTWGAVPNEGSNNLLSSSVEPGQEAWAFSRRYQYCFSFRTPGRDDNIMWIVMEGRYPHLPTLVYLTSLDVNRHCPLVSTLYLPDVKRSILPVLSTLPELPLPRAHPPMREALPSSMRGRQEQWVNLFTCSHVMAWCHMTVTWLSHDSWYYMTCRYIMFCQLYKQFGVCIFGSW